MATRMRIPAIEMIIKRALGDPSSLGYGIDAGTRETFLVEDLIGGDDNPLLCFLGLPGIATPPELKCIPTSGWT
jgi:hypothetical protein